MKEVVFLQHNTEKWRQFEVLLASRDGVDPDRLAELYVEVTDDLSHARTFYPKSKTVAYLNGLALKVHGRIYKNKRERLGRVITFFTEEFPLMMYAHRKELFYSFAFTVVGLLIGIISTMHDLAYVRLILGDEYVNMTLENIKDGNPLGIYGMEGEWSMFLWLPMHNILVAFRAFAYGVTLSLGTIWMLVSNGVMLGAFHTMFFQNNLLYDSLRIVWIHGTLEITAIVVAGCSGLVLGNSILFPGTYSRMQAFRNGAADGLKIILGTVPLLLVAGFLESFVTRHTGMPLPLNFAIIGGSLAFVIFYLVIHPRNLHRRIQNAVV